MTKNDIIAIISARTGISRTDVRLFLDKFNETVLQGLGDDQLVKIKGLGTFKMVSVKARKSVNVNGGEAIEIPAHNKVTFTAEKVFAEMVNEPLSHLEVVELSDSDSAVDDPAEEEADEYVVSSRMKKLGEDAEELKSLLADINGGSETTNPVPAVEESVSPAVEEPVSPVVEESEPTAVEESASPVVEESLRPAVEKPAAQPSNYFEDDVEKTGMTHGGKIGRIFLWSMLFLLIIFCSVYWVNFRNVADDEKTVEQKPVVSYTDNVVAQVDSVTPEQKDTVQQTLPESEKPAQQPSVESDKPAQKPAVEQKKPSQQHATLPDGKLTIAQMRTVKVDYGDIKATETVRDGSRLTMISLRAYGHKDFWIYLFLANRDQLSNPGQITTGMVIKIPKIDSRLIDASNPDCLIYAKELAAKYVK